MKENQFKKYLYISLAGSGGIILCILVFMILYRFDLIIAGWHFLSGILMPFFYGIVVAYMLTPVCNFLERHIEPFLQKHMKKASRAHGLTAGISIALSMIFGLLVVYILLALALPQVFDSIVSIVTSLPATLNSWQASLEKLVADNEIVHTYVEQFSETAKDSFFSWLRSDVLPNMQTIVNGVSSQVINVLVVLKNIFIGLIAAVYMMASRKRFAAQGKRLIYSFFPVSAANDILDEFRYIDQMFSGFLSGKIIDSLIIGCMCFVLMEILRLPYTVLVSVIVGVTNVIPFFGPYIGAIVSAPIILTVSPVQALYFLIMIFLLQQFDGNFLGPKILGNTTGLSSFWVLFSIMLFAGLFGFVGMIIGVPTFAVIYDLIRKISRFLLHKKKLSTNTLTYRELVAVEPAEDGYAYIYRETLAPAAKKAAEGGTSLAEKEKEEK